MSKGLILQMSLKLSLLSCVLLQIRHSRGCAELPLPLAVPIRGDVKIVFYHNPKIAGKVSKPFTASNCYRHYMCTNGVNVYISSFCV